MSFLNEFSLIFTINYSTILMPLYGNISPSNFFNLTNSGNHVITEIETVLEVMELVLFGHFTL
jgi:hypothetical protein